MTAGDAGQTVVDSPSCEAPAIDLDDVVAIAARHADEVDRASRFPAEALHALREARLLAACAPVAMGGLGHSVRELVTVAQALATGCAATAMTWAMHQIQLACLVRHGHSDYLRRYTATVCSRQLLLASATSEVGVGGDIRTSRAAIERSGEECWIDKSASTISYGEHADAILATVRRDPAAAPNDQVLVLMPASETDLEQLTPWHALGMRGTCSAGFRARAKVSERQVLPDPFEQILSQTMLPYSHLLWAACWLGIAGAALKRARDFLRQRERSRPGSAAVATTRLADAFARLQLASALTTQAADAADHGGDVARAWTSALTLNNVKISASQIAVDTTHEALNLCGFAGYQEQGPFSVARHLRDVLSAPLMIANERLLTANGGLLMSRKDDPGFLSGNVAAR